MQDDTVAVVHEVVVEADAAHETVVEEVEETEAAVTDVTVTDEVDAAPVVVDAVDEHDVAIIDVVEPVVETGADAAPAPETQEHAPTNVVSLFGRRAPQVPDLPQESGASASDHPVNSRTDGPHETRTDHSVDDIFARLRAGSTADVARASSAPAATDGAAAAPEAKATRTAKNDRAKPKEDKKDAFRATVDPARFAARNETVAPLVANISRKLKRVLADEQNNVLEHLRNKKSSLELDAVLGTVAEQAARYAAAVAEDAMTAAGAGAKSMKDARGSTRRVTQKAVDAAVAKAVAEGLVAGIREDARIAVGEAEGDRQVLAGLIRDVYRKWKLSGIDGHVDDIACAAYNTGAFLSLEPSAPLVWQVDPDNQCCGDCADNALAGTVAKGDAFPTGDTHPMAHAGCRCLIAPAAH